MAPPDFWLAPALAPPPVFCLISRSSSLDWPKQQMTFGQQYFTFMLAPLLFSLAPQWPPTFFILESPLIVWLTFSSVYRLPATCKAIVSLENRNAEWNYVAYFRTCVHFRRWKSSSCNRDVAVWTNVGVYLKTHPKWQIVLRYVEPLEATWSHCIRSTFLDPTTEI